MYGCRMGEGVYRAGGMWVWSGEEGGKRRRRLRPGGVYLMSCRGRGRMGGEGETFIACLCGR